MSEWTPKDGDKVMVGEHGPYVARVPVLAGPGWDLEETSRRGWVSKNVPTAWLSPAPEPEPEEPTAPGALVQFGPVLRALDDDGFWKALNRTLEPNRIAWSEYDRHRGPITVILADPAEVEQLRAEVESLTGLLTTPMPSVERLIAERDELQRRIDKMQAVVDDAEYIGNVTRRVFHRILRGEE